MDPGLARQRGNPGAKGDAGTGPNPTDRGKTGTKRHLLVDRRGTPLGLVLSPANRHDSKLLAATLDAVPPVRGQRGRPRTGPPSSTPTRPTTIASAATNAAPVGSGRAQRQARPAPLGS
ncbi:MAG TPA: transposase [Azospirillum sp.]|nr:transposase [Azospirillum sp.]